MDPTQLAKIFEAMQLGAPQGLFDPSGRPTMDYRPGDALSVLAAPFDPRNSAGGALSGSLAPNPQAQPSVQDFLNEANAIPDAKRKAPAFRTPDLLALLGAALAGPQAGQFLGGYLQSKGGIAQDDTNRAQNDVERRRQALMQQAQAAMQGQELQAKSAENAAERENRLRIALGNQDVKTYGIDKTLEGKKVAAEYRYKGAELTAGARAEAERLKAESGDARKMLDFIAKAPEEAKDDLLVDFQANFPAWGKFSPETLKAIAKSTAAEETKRAQAAKFRAEVGYTGIKGRALQATTGPKVDYLRAQAAKSRQSVDESIKRGKLLEEQAASVHQKTLYYVPLLRQKVAEGEIRKQQGQESKNTAKELAGWKLLKSAADKQIDEIKKQFKTNGTIPDALLDPDAAEAYAQAVKDQKEAAENIQRIGKGMAQGGVTPVTQGRPAGKPIQMGSGPMGAAPGQIGIPGVQLQPIPAQGRTRSGNAFRRRS